MPSIRSARPSSPLAVLGLGFLLAGFTTSCAADPASDDPAASPDIESIQFALTAIPTGTRCVRFTAIAGGRTFEEDFDTTSLTSLTASVHGLPVAQALTVSADAYAVACTSITATTQASWISAPVAVTLTPGVVPTVSFVLRPTGALTGTADFLFLAATPTTKAFGSLQIGQNASASFAVQNVGPAATGVLAATLVGLGAAQFAITANTCTAALAAGAPPCSITVRYAPTAPGAAKPASLQVVGTPGGTLTVALTGTGLATPVLALSPATQDFGAVAVGRQSPPVTYVVTNTGGATLTPVVVTSSDPTFVVAGSTCGILPAAQTCTFNVTFAPTLIAAKSATLSATADGITATASVMGAGVAAPALMLTPTVLSFGTVVVTQPKTINVTVRNVGGLPAGPLSVFLGGANTAQFTMDALSCLGGPATLQPNEMCVVNVTANPTDGAVGNLSATLLIMAGGANPTSAMATISATASYALAANFTSFNFGSVKVGTASSGVVVIYTNVGAVGIPGPIPITTSKPTIFTVGSNSCATFGVAPGGTCQVLVTFNAPATPGLSIDGLLVSGVAGGGTPVTFRGTAIP